VRMALVVLWVPLVGSAFHRAAIVRCATSRALPIRACADEAGELVNPSDMDALRSRIEKIQKDGIASPAQKLFELSIRQSPSSLMREFFATASPQVSQSMQDAVTTLLGALPPYQFDAQITTTGDKLAALMLQLQMTGYMLRNAEYVLTIRRVLGLETRSIEEYREAFNRLDLDESGFIEVTEVKQLFDEVYDGDTPSFEVSSFLSLFDGDGDGRISWDEFAQALGAMDAPVASLPLLNAATSSNAAGPAISGTVNVTLDDGTEAEMDAATYMEQLQAEAQNLRAELGAVGRKVVDDQAALSSSISAYVSSLPESQLTLLTSGISNDVVGAMKQLVSYILRAPTGKGELSKDQEVTMEQAKLQTLCLYQLVLGYKLREAEATGEANEAIGN